MRTFTRYSRIGMAREKTLMMRIMLTIEVDVPVVGSLTETKGKFDAQALKDIITLYGDKGLVFLSSESIVSARTMIDNRDGQGRQS